MRKTTLLSLALLLTAAPVLAQPPASPAAPQLLPSIALPPELARVLTDYEAAWSKRDPAALSRLFAEDGFVLPSGSPPVRGRREIERFYTGHGGPLSLRALAYSVAGDTGYVLGGYTGQAGSPDDGKFTLTLRKGGDGRWLIVSDMDNSNRKPKPAPEASPEAFLGANPGAFLAISAANTETLAAWYRDTLGFTVFSQGETPPGPRGVVRYALLQQGTALLEILQLAASKPRSEVAPGTKEPVDVHGFFKSGFVVQELDKLYERVKAKNVPLAFELVQPPNGPYRVFGVRDPEGNLLQFFGR